MKRQLIYLMASAALLAAGCSTENKAEGTEYGTLKVSCTADGSIDAASDDTSRMPAAPSVPQAGDFTLTVTGESGTQKWDTLTEFEQSDAVFRMGTYTVSVAHGDPDAEGIDKPYYAAEKRVEVLPRRAPGLPDEAFERGDVPMTKQEVRAAVLAKLAVRPEDILWDVGAGTGSVSVELALAAPRGRVYAVECRPEGCALIKANREKFRTRNLVLVEGLAPAALSDLPAPDAVFIGGSKGSLAAIVDAALDKNPDARICVSAIALETLSAAVAALTARGRTVQVSQIAVSRAKAVGGLHLMMAQNPIYLITGE